MIQSTTPASLQPDRVKHVRVCYGKLGRSVLLDPKKWGAVGGDNEPLALLITLAERNPDVTWVIAGRHSGDPGNLPPNVEVPELPRTKDEQVAWDLVVDLHRASDGAVLWLGQHGTTHMPTPMVKDHSQRTTPFDWARRYGGPTIAGLNAWQDDDPSRDAVWLCADPRNYLKARDLKWPAYHPILGQYDWDKQQRHWRWGDPLPPSEYGRLGVYESGHWVAPQSYRYSGLELTGIPRWEDEELYPFEEREPFGIIINEARSYVKLDRPTIVRDWITGNGLHPAFVRGTWSDEGVKTAGLKRDEVTPVHYTQLAETLRRVRCTFTTPTSGSQWATAKWWECAALGVVCFMHPEYDAQGHIVPTREQENHYPDATRTFIDWIRPQTPEALRVRVEAASSSESTWRWLVDMQRWYLENARRSNRCVQRIEERLGIAV